jgi:Tfp pilus assembly protein PilN
MRAVNLIPAGERRGAGGAAGRSGGGAYMVLGALALMVVLATAYTLAGKSVTDKKAELADVTRQAQVAESQAQGLTEYTKFASLRTKRVETVKQLANGRFDWSHALHEVARVLPTNAWLTSLAGTTSPGAGTGGSGLRGALPNPAIEVAGCTTSQASVAKIMARLRLIDGVSQVSLSDSTKSAATGGGAGDSAGGGDCTGGSSHFPKFTMVVFFTAPATTPGTPTTQTAASVTTSSTTPASTATPATTGGSTP